MVDSLRPNRGHPTVLAAAKLMHWSSPADGQFLLETNHEGSACQRHVVGGCLFKSGCGSDLANCTPCVSVGQESWFKFYGRPVTVMTDPE